MRTIAIVAIVVAAITVCSVGLLVWPFPLFVLANPAAEFEALRVSLTIGAGAAGIATLLLAARRQVHQEHVAGSTEFDASERRITDLYTKAVDQLGSEISAVRLGGLYALERLAENSVSQRQTVVNVICAYLRMPYVPPSPINLQSGRRSDNSELSGWGTMPGVIDTWATMAEYLQESEHEDSAATPESVQSALAEWQVRIAAQRILSLHLARPLGNESGQYWPNTNIDLSGAALFDFDFRHCRVNRAVFRTCRFFGVARFFSSTFEDEAEFDGAEFFGPAWFESATLESDAWFGGSHFHKIANFSGARFGRRGSFGGDAWLGCAVFAERVDFSGTSFQRAPELHGARVRIDDERNWSRSWPPGWVVSPSSALGRFEWGVLESTPAA